MDLLDAVIDRAADILERIGAEVDQVSHDIFEPEGRGRRSRELQRHPQGDRPQGRPDLEGARKPGLDRTPAAVSSPTRPTACAGRRTCARSCKRMQRDVQSLSDHATYLTNKITFLLDAMLGVVSIEQNNIIKMFSVAAVVLMPPTLIASIYGMNFKHMPELDWQYGYPIAIVLMVSRRRCRTSIFKWKKWL